MIESRKFALPLLAFAGGAILGRVLGLKRLMRGAMTAVALTGVTSRPALLGPDTHRSHSGTRRKTARGTSRRSAARRSSST